MKPKSPSPDPAPPRMPVRENQPDLTPLPIDDGKTDPPLPIREHPDGGRAPPDPIRRAGTPATPAVPATATGTGEATPSDKVGRNRGPVRRKKYPFPG